MNIIYVLILFAHVNSNAMTTQEFNSQETCIAAGNATKMLVDTGARSSFQKPPESSTSSYKDQSNTQVA